MHFIQKYILDKLIFSEFLRNRDMRPPNTESNLYQYHLKRLINSGFVKKIDQGYTLSPKGLQYADKHSSDLKSSRPQPKLVTILKIQNQFGDLLLVPRRKQPFIGMFNLPSGKIHEGESLLNAGKRELIEKAKILDNIELTPDGTVHLTISSGEDKVSELYGFILAGQVNSAKLSGQLFTKKESLPLNTMPSVHKVLNPTSLHQEINIDLYEQI